MLSQTMLPSRPQNDPLWTQLSAYLLEIQVLWPYLPRDPSRRCSRSFGRTYLPPSQFVGCLSGQVYNLCHHVHDVFLSRDLVGRSARIVLPFDRLCTLYGLNTVVASIMEFIEEVPRSAAGSAPVAAAPLPG